MSSWVDVNVINEAALGATQCGVSAKLHDSQKRSRARPDHRISSNPLHQNRHNHGPGHRDSVPAASAAVARGTNLRAPWSLCLQSEPASHYQGAMPSN